MTTKKKVYLASFIAPIAIMFVAWAIDGFFPFGTCRGGVDGGSLSSLPLIFQMKRTGTFTTSE